MNKKRRFASLAAALIILTGCDSVSTEDDPGSVANLCQNVFDLCISPILQNPTSAQIGCASSTCHGFNNHNGGGFFLHTSPTPTQRAFNFNSAQSFVNPASVSQSRLLAEPLIGDSGVPAVAGHTGGDIFKSTADLCYQQLLSWAQTTDDGSCVAACIPAFGASVDAAEVNACGT